jgi:hypothetical protein
MKVLILNSGNVVNNGFNDTYTYRFPSGSVAFTKENQIAVGSISIYYSWFSITSGSTESRYGNNTFSYVFPTSSGTTTVNVTIPDGFYTIAQLNAFLQSVMVSNGHYLVDDSQNNVYYLEITTNETKYAIQVNAYPVPTSLPSGWTNPASMTFPASTLTPQLVVGATPFRDVLGLNQGSFPPTAQATNYSKTSDYTPQVSPVQSLLVQCNLVNSELSNPTSLIYSFSPVSAGFGDLIISEPNTQTFVDCQTGSYDSITISFSDQSFRRIAIRDSNVVITLVIK